MTWIKQNAKALVGALVAGLGSLRQALDNNSVSGQEAVDIVIAALGALGFVWVVPNALSTAQAARAMVAARQREDAETHASRRQVP